MGVPKPSKKIFLTKDSIEQLKDGIECYVTLKINKKFITFEIVPVLCSEENTEGKYWCDECQDYHSESLR